MAPPTDHRQQREGKKGLEGNRRGRGVEHGHRIVLRGAVLKLRAGQLGKMSVYHQDANRIPESVRKLAETLFPGSKSLSFETEHYADAGLVYEVEVESQDGRHCEVSATADAKHRYTECRLSQDALPAAVSKKLETTLPGATVEELEVLKGPSIGGGEEYRAELKVGSVVHYLRLSPGGELLRHGILVPAEDRSSAPVIIGAAPP